MVSSLVAFSSRRIAVAFAIAASSAATASVKSTISSVSFAMEASNASISACSVSTASVFSFLVCSFVDSSVSHHPLCSASSFASSINLVIKSLIIFFTLRKGSAVMRLAKAERTLLLSSFALLCKKSCTWACTLLCESSLKAASDLPVCTNVGRYLSALPLTALLEIISMAFAIASNSSVRSCCRDAKSLAFCSQVAVKSARYFTSASRVAVVSVKSPSASAFACNFLAFVSAFSVLSCVACSSCAVRS
mmetsp:Transcript_97642/g.193343  ORF Transcript_97642/g.193343 Transcript_97642/m.193343 type:complete len:249 (+) Transcript_97642:641-1387(+)